LTYSLTNNTGLNFQGASGGAAATEDLKRDNLVLAINRFTGITGVTAQTNATSGKLTVTAVESGSNDIPLTENMVGLTAWALDTNGGGAPAQATIVAVNKLYNGPGVADGCNAATAPSVPYFPSVYWSYNTGIGKIAETSPVISFYNTGGTNTSGAQVAFVQRDTVATPDRLELVLLKWKAGDGTILAPATPVSAASAADYRDPVGVVGGCDGTTACMLVLPFDHATLTSDANSVASLSSPFVNYQADVLWVGDAQGNLRKFSGVFKGQPQEVVTGGFPLAVTGGNVRLTSPTLDFSTGNVFLGSVGGTNANGGSKLWRVNPSPLVTPPVASAQISTAGVADAGVRAPPMVDGGNGDVFVFVADDNNTVATTTTGAGVSCTTTPCQAVYRFPKTFTAGAGPDKKIVLGRGNIATTASIMYSGTFDSAYYSTRVGNLYVCGGVPGGLANDATTRTLWKIPVNSGVFSAATRGPPVSTGLAGNCSPLTQIVNPNTGGEYLYVSVPDRNNIASGNCIVSTTTNGGCLSVFNLTGLTWNTAAAPAGRLQVVGGTGGVILDNVSANPGSSQVYFLNLLAPINAFQASQGTVQ
jgi:hypothetical protein